MEKIKKFFKVVKLQSLLTALALIVVGILFMVFPADASRIVCITCGWALIIWGVLKAVTWFVNDLRAIGSYSLVGGIALLAFGILIVLHPDFTAGVVTLVFGILLIIDSVVKIQQAADMGRLKVPFWWSLLIVAAVTLVLGILIVCDPFANADVLAVFIGASLLTDGVLDIVTLIYYTVKVQKRVVSNKNVIDI